MTRKVPGYNIQHLPSPLSELKKILQSQVFPNALLFTGEPHSGKKQAALFFAKAANCVSGLSDPCDQCRSCKKINAGLHPDIIEVCCEEKKNISISQIRDITARISSKPNEAAVRMIIILDAETMNVPAQNALLKILEEPPERTIFILAALRLTDLLPTVISRCRHIRCFSLTHEQIQHHLITGHHINPESAAISAATCHGDLQKALRFLNLDDTCPDTDWIQRRRWILNDLTALLKQIDPWPASIVKSLFLSEKISSEPDLLSDSLLVIQSFLRDMAVFEYHPEKTINRDFFDSFKDIRQKYPYNTISAWTEYLFEAEQKIAANVTIRSTLEHFFLELCAERHT